MPPLVDILLIALFIVAMVYFVVVTWRFGWEHKVKAKAKNVDSGAWLRAWKRKYGSTLKK